MKKMRRPNWLLLLLLFILLGTGGPTVQAAAPPAGAEFYIAPIYPRNQTNLKLGYFALKVTPGQSATLSVQVQNISKTSTRTIRVSPTPATTSSSAEINYTPTGKPKDPTAQYTLNQLFSRPATVTLKPGEGKVVTFQYIIPKDGLTGQILGSIYALDETRAADSGTQFALQNHFAMAIGVLLAQDPAAQQPVTLTLRTVKPGITNHVPTILANVENQTAQLFRGMTATATVTRSGSDRVLYTKKIINGAMAPNSNFDLTIPADTHLTPGPYTLILTASAMGQVFHLRRNFTVSATAAQQLTVAQPARTNAWAAWLTAIAAILGAMIIFWIGLLARNRKGSDHYAPKHG
jgi:hypothetical protein